ncbi:MAG: hypothetical protein ACKO8L_00940 [Flavobacterium sp.]
MKNFKSIALALVAFVSFATTAQTGKKVDASKSTINWVGKKVTGSHEGTITLKVDRTKYDIKYGSGSFFSDLGDKTIYDDFDLTVKLAF